MTKILKMEMKGFKSFATKTEVLFGDNFNCILGPNGSGKSNVLDSLCFVLGKAGSKGLRVEKSSNLIYNGGKTKKPAKEGEVSIWFDNSKKVFSSIEEKEVKITRIIKGTGQGVYKINDARATRTQILDLLSQVGINPDGYNIILQGDIIRLIEMSSNERRQLVEEIAGISIYEDKKNKALRELNRVDEKLNEADIILAERESYLKELKKDKNKALKYKSLEDNRKRNKKTLIVKAINDRTSAIEKSQSQIDNQTAKIDSMNNKISVLREEINKQKDEVKSINDEVEQKGEKEQVKMHKIIEEMKVNVALNNQRLQTIESELEKLAERKKELKESHQELKDKTKNLENKKIDLEKRIAVREKDKTQLEEKIISFKKKHDLSLENKSDERIDEIDKEIEIIQSDMNSLRESQQNILREKDKVEMQLESIDEKLAKLLSVKTEHKRELDQLKQKKVEFKKTTLELNKILSESSDYAAQLSNARNKSLMKREELSKLKARQANIIERLAGGTALKAVLDMKKSEKGIYGTVAELGNVNKEFSQALEIAAGNRVKSVVVSDDSVAAKCIRYLKEKRLGIATFLPMNKIRSVTINESLRNMKSPGVSGLAVDLISYKSQFKKVFEYVFGNTLVVDSIQTARRIGIGTTRMVTISGDVVESSGAMQGGYRQKKQQGLFGQEEVNNQITQLESDLADQETIIFTLENKSQNAGELIDRLRALKAELEGDIIKTEKSLHLDSSDALLEGDEKKKLKSKNKELEDKIDELADKISEKNSSLAKLKIERQSLRDKLMELRNPAKLAELKSFDEKKMELSSEIITLSAELKHTITEMETVIGPDDRKILEIIKQHEKENETFAKEKLELKSKLSSQEKELKVLEKKEEAFYIQFKELFNKRSKLTEDISKKETKIALQTSEQRNIENKINALKLDQARLKAELSGFEEENSNYLDVEPFESKSFDLIKRELSEFDRLTADLGAVNMRALEIYEQVETEYKSILDKKVVLRKEREDVLLMMNEIDSKKKELFMRTFDSLQTNFKRIFSTLLMKGEATLELENKNDPFAGGVEIKVRLTGKRFLDIRSLSGGEKTMTALAFLFSVQEYEPASFYILDEVDAALDKKNSEKLTELIRGYCDHAQYIVISHNEGVISEADDLYGVSMNEHGMSKITSLKL